MKNSKSVFYSWQSDLPNKLNRYAIKNALKAALKKTSSKKNIQLLFDEATRGVSGSPNIPKTIFKKIQKSSIFICDISTINDKAPKEFRKVGNPNVMIELGYAIALLGWERIILLFNKAYGTFPDDLPFDIDRHRIMDFTIEEKSIKTDVKNLAKNLEAGITNIIDANPPRPSHNKTLTKEEILRLEDLENLRKILSCVNFNQMDEFIDDLPKLINSDIPLYLEFTKRIYSSSSFSIHDKDIDKLLYDFINIWNEIFSFMDYYEYNHNHTFIFVLKGDVFPDDQTEEAFNKINQKRSELYKAYNLLLKTIKSKFVEININETNRIAYQHINDSRDKPQKKFSLSKIKHKIDTIFKKIKQKGKNV
jgi:hypothetical protein